jgi:uncharacterized protein YbbC (DUF1343 family)
LVVLDRPNPLGRGAYGPRLEPGYASFVGAHPVRFVHEMTLGVLACVLARDFGLTHTLLVVTMRGAQRRRLSGCGLMVERATCSVADGPWG